MGVPDKRLTGDSIMLSNNMRSRLVNIPRLGKVGDELSKFQGKNRYAVID
jgi:hypothetical protein